MNTYFSLKDYIFSAMMAAAMVITGYLTVPLVVHIPIPGIRSVISAPFMAVFFTLALAKIEKVGAATLIAVLVASVYSMISIILAAMIIIGGIITDATAGIAFRSYRKPVARYVAGAVYFGNHVFIGILLGRLFIGGHYTDTFARAWPIAGMTAAVSAFAVAGVWFGNRLVIELRRAGKFPQIKQIKR